MTIEIRVPTLGESITEATVGKWFKKPGDAVKVDEPLVELETDKVTVEVPSPGAGVLSDIAVKQGATVAIGAVLGALDEKGAAAAAPAKPAPKSEPAKSEPAKPAARQESKPEPAKAAEPPRPDAEAAMPPSPAAQPTTSTAAAAAARS